MCIKVKDVRLGVENVVSESSGLKVKLQSKENGRKYNNLGNVPTYKYVSGSSGCL